MGSCRTVKETETSLSRKEHHYSGLYDLVNYPATLVLTGGDTIRARFTFSLNTFYQVHENNDSNINRTGKENEREGAYYPVSTWYKCFSARAIKNVTVNGESFESVFTPKVENGNDSSEENQQFFFLRRISPDSSQVQLYFTYTPRTHGETHDIGDVLANIAWDAITPELNTYYIHFPGDPARKVRCANQTPAGLAAKAKIAELFSTCPELQPLAEQIKASSDKEDLTHALLSKEQLKYAKTNAAMLEVLKKYDDCYYRNKK